MTKLIDHHPIRFNHSTECNMVDSNWHQLAQYGDVTQWQMGLEPCALDQNAIENGGFTSTSDWVVGTNWTINTAGGYASKSTGSSGTIYQSIDSADDVLWRVSFSVDISSGGFIVAFGTYFITYISETGNYQFFVIANNVSNISFSGDGTTSGIITNIAAVPINTNFKAWLVDEDGSDVQSFDSSDFSFNNGWLTHSIDWEDLTINAGCYTLEVSDPCVCSQGGLIVSDMTTNQGAWTLDPDWSFIGSGAASFNPSGTTVGAMTTVMSACEDVTYTVSYTITQAGTANTNIFVGGVSGITRTGSGAYVDTIVAGSTNEFEIRCQSTGAATMRIEDVVIERTVRTRDYISVPIKVSEVDIDCTYRINACCDSDNMGAGYSTTGFTPAVRMSAQFAQGGMTADRNSYEYSTGKKSTTYYRGRKNKSLKFMCPSYIHDFLMHLGGYDHVYVDGEEVFVEDDEYPTVSWNDQTDLGTVTLTMRDKEVLIENRRISTAVKGCDPNGSLIYLNTQYGIETWLDPETGETITL